MPEKHATLLRAGERGDELRFQHPLNEKSEIFGHQLSRRVGLKRAAVNLCGGEQLDLEVSDYPRLGLRLIRKPDRAEVVPLDALEPIA